MLALEPSVMDTILKLLLLLQSGGTDAFGGERGEAEGGVTETVTTIVACRPTDVVAKPAATAGRLKAR
jgi:hypothetical protein